MRHSLLYGNGLNLATENGPKWEELLQILKGDNSLINSKLPNTMIYEKIFLERNKPSLDDEIYIKNEISNIMQSITSSDLYEKIIKLNLEHYMTTNYDYAFQKTFAALYKSSSVKNMSTEKIYSIRRHWDLKSNSHNSKLWHIHGEIDHPKSIQLGLDHYGGYLSKIDSYIKGNYVYEKKKVKHIENKCAINSKVTFDNTSWIELFFNTNLHILGLGLNYHETDIWWLLNKRARLMLNKDIDINNKIYLYTDDIDIEKEQLLISFNIQIIKLPTHLYENGEKDYKKIILEAIKKISELKSNISIN